MKIFIKVLMILALLMVVFNATKIDYNAPLQGDSSVAVIGVLASTCALLLLFILLLSKKIAEKVNK
ncbi:MAG: hypothetical protein ACKVJM_01185 [Flavobacteriales bacterium]|jgi:hypothetical protein|nr:hypothetical protein [Flavobacteriaceae bacterium]MDO7581352.1 hypothetical protein [Flavobacteriaceae bacterium]MDO7591332.1 hypothetical protein [Flavobacteriaceae bacterium]MDO7599906.1 hypothetical protein [Flavobacteriaceae bacterium]MDO7602456.1 hypothetical protein [Flavobacteriaceae bacterium]|tara:strand:+ start:1066 stop:1263 length:198 start_codon:yes stop_codon:yes gene_type:complete